jgi:hypothetical protein
MRQFHLFWLLARLSDLPWHLAEGNSSASRLFWLVIWLSNPSGIVLLFA